MFIKKFKTNENYYIYDVNSNEILKIDEITFNILDEFRKLNIQSIKNKFKHKYNTSEIKKKYEIIKTTISEKKYLSDSRPEISFEKASIGDIEKELSSNLQHLILELTEKCNQRCKYCGFSGRYRNVRTHGNSDMSVEKAKKAVHFFIERSKTDNSKTPGFGFYGGEPLIRFDLIKQIVNYVKSIYPGASYRFSLTTNGTLLNNKIIDYFYKNNISITISLDGPKQIHDRYRVFLNGKGTFKTIMENLISIKNNYPEYFKNNISFNIVLAPPYKFDSIISFFCKNPFFKEIGKDLIMVTFVDNYETTFFIDFELEKSFKEIYLEMSKLRTKYKDALINEHYNSLSIEKQIFNKRFTNIHRRSMEILGQKTPPLGTCFPGQRRLFVNTSGNFFMCERVNSCYKIGDIDHGFDYKRIARFFYEFAEFFKECRDCWAIRFCKKCFNSIRKGSNFDLERKNQFCIEQLNSIEQDLIDYCEIREINDDAFKVLDKLTII